eukprot:6202177-Pleurochrysis_carterae.AAC.3
MATKVRRSTTHSRGACDASRLHRGMLRAKFAPSKEDVVASPQHAHREMHDLNCLRNNEVDHN